MTEEEARNRQLASWLAVKAKSTEAEHQRVRMEEEEAQRRWGEDKRLEAQKANLRQLTIEQEALRRAEEIEGVIKELDERFRKAAADFQRRRTQYLTNYYSAGARLDSECRNLETEWNDALGQIKDPATHENLRSNTQLALEWMRQSRRKAIEDALRKQASECYLTYISPF